VPSLPPSIWAELYYSGTWNDVTDDVLTRAPVTVTRGLSSESSSTAEPTSCTCDLASRDNRYAPRNPSSPLYGLIGRNTPFRWGYEAGPPWALFDSPDTVYQSLFVNDTAALDVTGDLDLRLDIALEDWSKSQLLALRAVPSSNYCWALEIVNGALVLQWYPDGTTASRAHRTATDIIRGYNGQRMAVRATLDINNGAGGHTVRFYTGRTVDDEEWHLLGEPVTASGTTSVFAGNAYMEIGGSFGASNLGPDGGFIPDMRGRAYGLKLLDGSTVKVNMSTASATPGGGTFVDSTGVTWGRGGTAVLTNRHIRMAGEVPAWPPTRDLSGNDNYVSINPSGLTRRMDAGNRPQDSALLRYIKNHNPVECWPLTDGPRTTGAKSLVGGQDMQQEILIGEDTAADWQGGSLAEWIEPVLSVKARTTGHVRGGLPRTAGTDAFWSVDLFLSGGGIPSTGQFTVADRGAGTDEDNQHTIQIIFTGSLDRLTVVRQSYGAESSSSSLLGNIDGVGIYDEEPHHLRLSIDPQSPSTLWYLYVDGTLRGNGTISSIVFKSAQQVLFGWGFATIDGTTMTDRSVGYITYWDGTGPSAADIYEAYMGFPGEKAGTRIERLATENGYTASVAGGEAFQQPLGIQGQKKLLDLLTEASRTDFGYLLDARDRIEIIHRSGSTLWNQEPALVLDYSAGLISPPFRPVDDDKLTENDVSVRREFGSVPAREVLEEGEMSVLAPEDGGVGRYDTSYTYSLETDDQARQVAGMRLHLGTYNGVRYTRITLNLANPRVFEHIDDILRLDVGDKLRLTNLPPDHGPDDVDVLVAGYTEEAGPDTWTITFNCVPGEPWNAAVVESGTYGRVDTAGSELARAVTESDTSIRVTTTAVRPWVQSTDSPTDFPFDIRTGGEVMRVTACTPLAYDSFTRTVAGGWGTAPSGQAWTTAGGTTSTYDVNGSAGRHIQSPFGVSRHTVIPVLVADVDVRLDWSMSAGAATVTNNAYAVARYTGTDDMYMAQAQVSTSGTITIALRRRVAGTETELASLSTGLTHTPGAWYSLRFEVRGSTLRAKTWPKGETEPTAWQVTATDTSLTAAGSVGFRTFISSTSTAPAGMTVSCDTLAVSPQLMQVTRSINGVVKTHSAGQDVRLATPVYVAL
jgi:hypothetical protein